MADKKKKKWISGAIKHPGALHKTLGVPEGEKIPEAKLQEALHSKNATTRKRANLAMTLKGMNHKKEHKTKKPSAKSISGKMYGKEK